MIDLADTITLTYPTKPASPATVTVTIGLPDNTTAGPFSAISGSYTYTTTQAGRHTVLWVSTGPSDAYSDSFDVATQTPGYLISLDDAKAQLRVTQSTNDEELRLYLAATTAVIEHHIGPVLQNSHVEIVDAAETIVLAHAPVTSVTSIVPTFNFPDWLVWSPQYQLDGPAGILRQIPLYPFDFGFSVWLPNGSLPTLGLRLTVTYVAGRTDVPAAVQAAARIVLEGLWESRRLAGPKPASGDEQIPYGRDVIPERAMQLLTPYRIAPKVG